jgi:SAM-dependent methyltransferase
MAGGLTWHAAYDPCPLCGADRPEALGRRGGSAHHRGLGEATTVVRCQRCHGVYQRPVLRPSSNPYEAYPASEYFHGRSFEAKVEAGRALARRATALLGRTGRLLELGCGEGGHLVGARAEGWSVSGVEMTPGFPAASNEIPIEIAPLEEATTLHQTFDVVLLAAILEHVYDPRLCLKRVREALTPGGLVFLDVPNECSLFTRVGNAYMRIRGRDWAVNMSPTFPPFHVVGFCPPSLRALLEAMDFEVVELTTHRWQNELGRRPGFWPAIEHLGLGATLTLGAWAGMGAGITCWARRPRPSLAALPR